MIPFIQNRAPPSPWFLIYWLFNGREVAHVDVDRWSWLLFYSFYGFYISLFKNLWKSLELRAYKCHKQTNCTCVAGQQMATGNHVLSEAVSKQFLLSRWEKHMQCSPQLGNKSIIFQNTIRQYCHSLVGIWREKQFSTVIVHGLRYSSLLSGNV